jgi:heme/copper-type cytochrome/quinol oxidase subunit 2
LTQTLLPATFGVLGVVLLGIIVWGITDRTEGGFLSQLADEETARGLITFLIAITTVGIAVILAISTVVLKESAENDKRFDRGKQVLTILIGVLGTIVGFYFGSAQETENTPPATGPGQTQTLTITTTTLPAATVNMPYSTTLQATGGTPPLTWSVTPPELPPGLTLDAGSGTISGTPMTVPQRTPFTFTVRDSRAPPVSSNANLTLEIK